MRNRRTTEELKIHNLEIKKARELQQARKVTKTLGEKIIAFDNAPISDIRTFNEIFGEVQGGNPNDELIIGDLFTCDGRYLYRNGKEIRYLFKSNDFYGNMIYDVYDKESKSFIKTHTTMEDIATQYGISKGTVVRLVAGKDCSKAPIKVYKLCHYKAEAV